MLKRMFIAWMLVAASGTPAWAQAADSSAQSDLASALYAEPAHFTLQFALATAVRNNPDIQAAEAKLEEAKLDAQVADLWWANSISANANLIAGNPYGYTANTNTGTFMPTAAAGVGVNLGSLLAGPKNAAKARHAVDEAEAGLKKTTLQVAAQVTAAYQEYQAAKQVAGLGHEMQQAADTDLMVAERSFERGQSAANGLVGARLAAAHVKVDRITQNGAVLKSWSNLLSLMGTPDWLPDANAAAPSPERR